MRRELTPIVVRKMLDHQHDPALDKPLAQVATIADRYAAHATEINYEAFPGEVVWLDRGG